MTANNAESNEFETTKPTETAVISIPSPQTQNITTVDRTPTYDEERTLKLSVDQSPDYQSPEIFLNKNILLTDDHLTIKSQHDEVNWNEMDVNKCHLIRDFIFFMLYWIGLLSGILANAFYVRLAFFLLWILSLILTILSHIYFTSPPFYPLYRGSHNDYKYSKYMKKSAEQYILDWNDMGLWNGRKSQLNRTLEIKLCYVQTFGGFSDSNYGSVDIIAKKIENKNSSILDDIIKHQNKLIRLRIFHILTFYNKQSHDKFVEILKSKKDAFLESAKAEQTFHIEYNVEFEQRLLMNTTNNGKDNTNCCNECCSNRNVSYILYATGFGFFYRLYHDFYVETQIYDCIKEVTL